MSDITEGGLFSARNSLQDNGDGMLSSMVFSPKEQSTDLAIIVAKRQIDWLPQIRVGKNSRLPGTTPCLRFLNLYFQQQAIAFIICQSLVFIMSAYSLAVPLFSIFSFISFNRQNQAKTSSSLKLYQALQ
ncbi:MAG: hypothetical protein ACQEXX_18680 [Bacillota bacterium]